MRKILTIVLLAIMISCNDKKNDLKLESHEDMSGFSIKYPSSWDTTKQDNRVIFMAYEVNADTTDNFNESLNVSMFQVDGIILEDFVDENIRLTQQRYPNQKIEKRKGKNSKGLDFYSIVVDIEANGLSLINNGTFFSNGNKFYTLTQTIEKNKLTEYQPLVDSVVESFDWTK